MASPRLIALALAACCCWAVPALGRPVALHARRLAGAAGPCGARAFCPLSRELCLNPTTKQCQRVSGAGGGDRPLVQGERVPALPPPRMPRVTCVHLHGHTTTAG